MERRGPRGGQWFTATPGYQAWAASFNERARAMFVGRRVAQVRRTLSGEPSPGRRLRRTHFRAGVGAMKPSICGKEHGMATSAIASVNCKSCLRLYKSGPPL